MPLGSTAGAEIKRRPEMDSVFCARRSAPRSATSIDFVGGMGVAEKDLSFKIFVMLVACPKENGGVIVRVCQ